MSKRQNKTGGRAATTGHIAGDYALAVGMPSTPAPVGWKWTLLTDVARLETGHTPSRKFPEYWDGDVPWVGIRDATGNHGQTIHETNQYTTDLGIENSSARILPANTVCLSRTASVGYVIVMGRPMATSQDFVNWVCSDDLDYRFLKYVLLAEKRSFLRFAHGTTHQTIYFPEVKAFHICLPPIEEQRAIASILGALDDKIELNRRMNATLESLARAIFKSWFVDFDPVRQNAVHVNAGLALTGQMPASSAIPTTHDPKVLELFPSTFQDSELGPIPEGWSVEPLSNLADVVMGTSPKSSTYNEHGEGTPLVNGPVEFGDYFPVKRKWTTAPTRFSEPNDLIFCVRGSTTGRRIHSDGVYCLGRGVCAIRSLNEHQAFINQTIEFELRRMLSRVTGSVFPNLSAPQIKGFKIVAPSHSVLTEFSRYIEPIETKMAANVLESETLSSHRDALLPQLLSGELPVPEALTQAEEVPA